VCGIEGEPAYRPVAPACVAAAWVTVLAGREEYERGVKAGMEYGKYMAEKPIAPIPDRLGYKRRWEKLRGWMESQEVPAPSPSNPTDMQLVAALDEMDRLEAET
jgi:hypothetical protein